MSEINFIDAGQEKGLLESLSDSLTSKVQEWETLGLEAKDIGVFAFNLKYSGGVAMYVLHCLPIKKELPGLIALDVPKVNETSENVEKYKVLINTLIPFWKQSFKKLVIVSAYTDKEVQDSFYSFVLTTITEHFKKEDVLVVSLVEHEDANPKSQLVGTKVKEAPKFWWEANLNLD
jgi:hypothetical protein